MCRRQRCYAVPSHVLAAISQVKTPQGVAAVWAMPPSPAPEEMGNRLILLENVQDPPATWARCCAPLDAAGFDGCILTPGCADPFGPKALRATMGSVFRVPVCSVGNTVETVQALNARGYATLAAALDGENFYRRAPLPATPCACVSATRAPGSQSRRRTRARPLPPSMRGGAESLNAAVAAAVMMYDLINRE